MMPGVRIRIAFLASLAAAAAGCGQIGTLADRYHAEQMLWWAQRAEKAARLGGAKPDSAKLLELREGFSKIGRVIRPPYIRGKSPGERAVGGQLQQIVGSAELQAARLAVQANRPELALDEMKRVASMAETDSMLRRQCDFFRVGTLRQFQRRAEAIALMREMLARYRPMVQRNYQDEDPILAIPEGIVRMYRDGGDEEGAKRELAAAAAYYRGLLQKPLDPRLEAQVSARLMRVELEVGDWNAAFETLGRLESLVRGTPELMPLMPELQFAKARLRSARDRNTNEAIALMDRVAVDYPASPFAANALFEAGVLLERQGRRAEALDRYKSVALKYANVGAVAPMAAFRRAMLEEQMGNWEEAKSLLESIPVQYPESQAAVEAPIAVVKRYVRIGNRQAAETALAKAVATFRGLIARDTTSNYCPIYRWAIARVQLAQGDWGGCLETTDEIVRRDLGHPFAAEALLEAGKVARQHGQNARAAGYLAAFLKYYPKSPVAGDVRANLEKLAQEPPGPKGT